MPKNTWLSLHQIKPGKYAMKRGLMKGWIKVFMVIVIIIVLSTLFSELLKPRLGNTVDWSRPPALVLNNANLISRALYQYQSSHNGHLPSHLSELVPNYVSYDNIQLFFWPKKPWAITNFSPEVLAREIDNDGIFIYLGEAGFREDLILYERTNLWSKLNQGWIVDSNFQALVVRGDKVLNCLSRLRR